MRALTARALAILLPTATVAAQLLVAPEGMALGSPAFSSLIWRNTSFRLQQIFDSSHFTNQGVTGPVSIQRLRFRAAPGVVDAGGQIYQGDGASQGVTVSLGTSANDYLSASVNFAANRGAMQTVLSFGSVQLQPAGGGAPNDYVIDITLPVAAVYDPTTGEDLLLEIDAPQPIGAPPPLSCSAFVTQDRVRRISSGSQAAQSGSLSGLCGVVLFDIAGGGGVQTIVAGESFRFGEGCYESYRAVGEQFTVQNPFDLAGAGVGGVRFTPDVPFAPTAYRLTPVSGQFYSPTGLPLGGNTLLPTPMTDDGRSEPIQIGNRFTFPYVGGVASVVHASSNGYVELQPMTGNLTDPAPDPGKLANGPARLLPFWFDLDPTVNRVLDPSSGVHFDVDLSGTVAYITWLRMGASGAAAGASSYTAQLALFADGTFEYRYFAPFVGSAPQPVLVGFTPGNGALAPPSSDISAAMPLTTSRQDMAPLQLHGTAPILGDATLLTTSNIPANAIATANMISFIGYPLGFDLASSGAAGCRQYILIAGVETQLVFGSPQASISLSVPNQTTFLGMQLYSQSGSLVAGVNPLGLLTSNGVGLVIGTVR